MYVHLKRRRARSPVQVRVAAFRHIIIDDNINSFDVNSSAEEVCGHHNSFFEVFELLVAVDPAAAATGTAS